MILPERPTPEETRVRWRAFEKHTAALLAGDLVPGSGSKHEKGDARSAHYRAECKYRWNHDENGFYIDLDLQWLEGIYRHTVNERRTPILALEFGSSRRLYLTPAQGYMEHVSATRLSDRMVRVYEDTLQVCGYYEFVSLEIKTLTWCVLDGESVKEMVYRSNEVVGMVNVAKTSRIKGRGFKKK